MEEKLSTLKNIWKNIRKTPNRTYTKATITKKLEQIEDLKKEFQLLESNEENNKEAVAFKLEFYNYYKIIKEYLNKNIRELLTDIQEENTTDDKMAGFNIEIASKTIPLFAGNYEELESFIITTELVNKTLSDIAKQDFLQYLYHAKLTSNVRTAIGSYKKPDNLDTLIDLLRQRYKNTKTIPELQSRLNCIYQGKISVNTYKEKINTITDNLNRLGIEELGNAATEAEKNVIIRLNQKLALDAFKRGINENIKTAIFAARPKTIQEAVELALELENEHKLTNNNKIMQIQRHQSNNHQAAHRNKNYRTAQNQFNRNNIPHDNRTNRNPINRNNPRNNNNSNYNRGNNFNANNQQRNSRPNYNRENRNNRNNIYTIQGNEIGSECMNIPDSQI